VKSGVKQLTPPLVYVPSLHYGRMMNLVQSINDMPLVELTPQLPLATGRGESYDSPAFRCWAFCFCEWRILGIRRPIPLQNRNKSG
jgi:hypothetical protein